jgi:hypothetical protein
MGTILKRKFDLTSLSNIKKAYLAVFPNEKKTLEGWFNAQDLKLLEACRHVIVHRVGVVDQEFIDKTTRGDALNQPLPLKGELVSRAIAASINAAVNLLGFADRWLRTNPA